MRLDGMLAAWWVAWKEKSPSKFNREMREMDWSMETIMLRIVADCGAKQTALKAEAQAAHDELVSTQGNGRVEPWALREKVLGVVESALEQKGNRLAQDGLDGLLFLLRDNQLHSLAGQDEAPEHSLPAQVLAALSSLPAWTHAPNIQCHCLTITLQLICSSNQWLISSDIVTTALELCLRTFAASTDEGVKMASRASASQIVTSYCTMLYKEQVEDADFITVFQEVTNLLSYAVKRLSAMSSSVEDNPSLLLAVDAVLAILQTQTSLEIGSYEPLATVVWRELSPALVALLGLPVLSQGVAAEPSAPGDGGRGASAVGSSALFGAPQVAKSVYCLCGELLRLFGSSEEMRSVLESLFHRLFLFPPPAQRSEVLQSFKKILGTPTYLLAFFAAATEPSQPPVYDSEQPLNLNLWKIVLDSLVECCRCDSVEVVAGAIEVVEGLVGAWAKLCEGPDSPLPPSVADGLNRRFKSLRHTDLLAFAYPKGEARPLMLTSLLSGVGVDLNATATATPQSTVAATPEPPSSPLSSEPPDSKEEESEGGQGGEGGEGMDDALRSVAERIGVALRNLDEPEKSETAGGGEVFRSIQDMLREERRRACCLEGDASEVLDDDDRNSAQILVAKWRAAIPEWNSLKSVIEVDMALQKFASDFSSEYMSEQELRCEVNGSGELWVLNADAVYLASLGVLRLCLQLSATAAAQGLSPLSETAFVREILEGGCVVYARESWLRAVYQEAVRGNVKELLGQPTPLLHLVQDYEGRELLRDVQRLEAARRTGGQPSQGLMALRKLARHVLTASWEGLMRILSGLVEMVRTDRDPGLVSSLLRNLGRGKALLKAGNPALLIANGLTSSLVALQKMASLCVVLKLESRSGWIFRQVVEISCPLDELRELGGQAKKNAERKGLAKWRRGRLDWQLRSPDVLSIEILLSNAIQAGGHAPECWQHAIRCCEYVWELERFYHLQPASAKARAAAAKANGAATPTDAETQEWDLGFEDRPAPVGKDLIRSQSQSDSVAELLAKQQSSDSDVLPPALAKMVIDCLIHKVEDFLEDTSRCLNLGALQSFTEALITSSENRVLYSLESGLVEPHRLLERLAANMTRAAKGSRPLAHLMRLWPRVASHFVQCACSKDGVVANAAVSCLHQCISTQLGVSEGELEGFHFHQLLLSPLQSILCLDLCEIGTQDAIVCTLAELVESHAGVMRSGWRPVFGALKAVRTVADDAERAEDDLEPGGLQSAEAAAAQRMQRTVLDLFNSFLAIEDWEAPAPAEAPTLETEMDCEAVDAMSTETENLYKAALACIHRLHHLLASLFPLNRLPAFQLLHRLKLREQSVQWVEASVAGRWLEALPSLRDSVSSGFFARSLEDTAWLEGDWERSLEAGAWAGSPGWQRGVLEAWLTLVEGLVGAVATCPRAFQAELLRVLFELLESLQKVPGRAFGDYCLRHSVLPMLQQWLRRESALSEGWRENSASVRNFKQTLGLLTQLVVDYAGTAAAESEGLIEDLLLVLVEAIGQGSEVVSRLGASCLRHFALAAGPDLTPRSWDILCRSLWKATQLTQYHLRVLMRHFAEGSREYYGDMGKVQVALRKDSNPREAKRVKALAQQVFLLESQKAADLLEEQEDALSKSYRSVVLLVTPSADDPLAATLPPNEDGKPATIRMPFRDVVIGLLSQQLLLQLLGALLLQGSDLAVAGVSSYLLRQVLGPRGSVGATGAPEARFPGLLNKLCARHVSALLLCLEAAFQVALEFDLRPGLKFLLQRVFNSTVAANLYKQTSAAWALRTLVLLEMGRRSSATIQEIKQLCKNVEEPSKALISDSFPKPESLSIGLRLLAEGYWMLCQVSVDAPPIVFLLASEDSTTQLLDAQAVLAEAVTENHEDQPKDEEEGGNTGESSPAKSVGSVDSWKDAEAGKEESKGKEPEDDGDEDEPAERVYRVVTSDTVKDVVSEYKKRKRQAVMPAKPHESPKKVPASERGETTEEELRAEQDESVMRDEEGRCLAWTEMGVGLLGLVAGAEEGEFVRLLPVVFSSTVLLADTSTQPRIRGSVAQLLQRLNAVFRFAD